MHPKFVDHEGLSIVVPSEELTPSSLSFVGDCKMSRNNITDILMLKIEFTVFSSSQLQCSGLVRSLLIETLVTSLSSQQSLIILRILAR